MGVYPLMPPSAHDILLLVHAKHLMRFELGVSCELLLGEFLSATMKTTTKRDKVHTDLAQLARASPLQGEGRGFESLNAH